MANGVHNSRVDTLSAGKIGTPLQLRVQGAANALISVQHTSGPQTVNGLRSNLLNTSVNRILTADGTRTVTMAAVVQLVDKHAVRETRLPLHYDIAVVYQ